MSHILPPPGEATDSLRALLEDRYLRYNSPAFVPDDPVAIPHRYSQARDQEVAGLLAATLAWGQRPTILRSCLALLARMDDAPHAFVCQASTKELDALDGFVHRTFNGTDARSFVLGLRHIYTTHASLEDLWLAAGGADMAAGLQAFHAAMTTAPGVAPRSHKHVPDVQKGAAAKRLNMYLRWMVRQDRRGVDLGLWTRLSPAGLLLPLDLHTGRVARALGLLHRPQSDWRAVQEVTAALRLLDPADPVKYDFALFGLGIYEGVGR
jgi:uncharacterized protein (TIGR02757 family)